MATKYVSALNGQQMDAALTDMAYHTSEAFAIGERNGVPVSSGDVAYQNNAKYYAEQASADATEADAAAARAEAAVPPSTAGAVFFDRAQALTDAQKGQAKANIGAGSTNRNLLDNAYFVGGGSQLGGETFPINQRGLTNYTGDGSCTIDRWIIENGMTLALESGGIRVTAVALYTGLTIDLPAYKLENGETYTISVKVDGDIHSATFVANNDGNWANVLYGTDWYTPYRYISGVWQFKVLNAMNVDAFNHLVQAVKLEKGSVSTLANDVPPDFGEELRKCQRYLYVLNAPAYHFLGEVALAGDATNCTISFHLPAEMRTTAPSVTLTSGLWVGGVQTTAVNWTRTLGTTVVAACTVTGGLSGSTLYAVATGASATTITISAEL